MNWTSAAILSAAIMAAVNVISSHLLSRRMPSLRVFLLAPGIIQLSYALLTFYLFPFPEGVAMRPIWAAVASGIFRTAAVLIMLYYFKREEVSRVIPVIYIYPVFVAIMAVPLLGEALSYLQWLAVIIVVAGAVVVSAEKSPATTGWLSRTALHLFAAGLLFAVADVANKYALGYISFWNGYSITAICMSSTFWIISMRPRMLRQLRDMKQKKLTLTMLFTNELIAPSAVILSFWAMQRGPVSLVSTIIGSRPVFVAIFSLILSRVLPGFLKKIPGMKVFVVRLVAILMIFGGISIIYLT